MADFGPFKTVDLVCTYKTKRIPSCNPISGEKSAHFFQIILAFLQQVGMPFGAQTRIICLLHNRNDFDILTATELRRVLFG